MEATVAAEPWQADSLAGEMAAVQAVVDDMPKQGAWDWIWDAFWRLDADRPRNTQGMAAPMGGSLILAVPGAIPWTVLDRFCEAHDRDADERELLEVCVRKMEDLYLPWWVERNRPRTS